MFSALRTKVKILNETMWGRTLPWSDVERWLSRFKGNEDTEPSEKLHALYLLSHFSYFNSSLMKVLLKSLFRDLIQYPVITKARRKNKNSLEWSELENDYNDSMKRIKIVGIGNPSESGTHLLYYFRQENELPVDMFISTHEIFSIEPDGQEKLIDVDQLIFLDDFCGSGSQAVRYSKNLLSKIVKIDQKVRLSYFPLFATSKGLNYVKKRAIFHDVATICELDPSFASVDKFSRYFKEQFEGIDKDFAFQLCKNYGNRLEPSCPLGFKNGQLLLGFAHNIPNNSLPIFWSDGRGDLLWDPVFRRYKKDKAW